MTYGMWLDELIITMVCPSILMEKISITFVHYTNTSKRKVSPYYYILYPFIIKLYHKYIVYVSRISADMSSMLQFYVYPELHYVGFETIIFTILSYSMQ